jgi:predicted transcriptional regulator of viral defense system
VAILFWLKAIKEIKEDRFIISPFIEFDPTFLDHMDKVDLFTFAAFLQHETLTVEHHAMIFHQGLQSSKLQLSRLEKNGILIQRSRGYQIHYLLYRPVVKTLKLHNIIH